MKRDLTIKQVIKELKKFGINIVIDKGRYVQSSGAYGPFYYTEREIYKLHQGIHNKTTLNKILKTMTNSKDRAATRDIIKTEKFDSIPDNKRVKKEDRWNWD